MFSVIIPLYNKAPYICKAINSVLNQTYTNFEIIVINDGSTDNSLEIVKQIKNEKIFIIDRENKGVSFTRNQGVDLAKYEYIAFLDADDWWSQTYLEEMSKLIEKYPSETIYSCNFKKIKNNKEENSIIRLPENFEGKINYFQLFNEIGDTPLCIISTIINKQNFKKIGGFDVNLKGGEDLMLWIKLVNEYSSVVFSNKYLVYYNYDVNDQDRAICKVFSKENYFLFYLDVFKNSEKENQELKKLLDFIRINFSKIYYRNSLYSDEINKILNDVDDKNYSLKNKIFYSISPIILNFIYKIIKKNNFIFQVS